MARKEVGLRSGMCGLFQTGTHSLGEGRRCYQADYLPCVDQEIED